ncbi:MAG: undecaprenyl-phosphate glucose phosphotransferase [Lachnospiraceae bacterium]
MIKNNQQRLNRLHIVLDAFFIMIAYVLAWFIKMRSGLLSTSGEALPVETYMAALIFVVPGYLLLYYFFHLYTPKRQSGRRAEFANIVKSNTVGLLVFILILYLSHESAFSREMLFIFYCVNIVISVSYRFLLRYELNSLRSQGFNLKHILLVGYSRAAEDYIDRIMANPQWGYVVYGILDDNVEHGTTYKGVKVLGRIDNLQIILPENKLDEIAITLSLTEYYKLEHIVDVCEKSGVHTKFIPDYNNMIPTRPYTEDILGLPVINIRHTPLNETFNKFIKRLTDLIGASFAFILFSPVMLITALLIKLTSPGPLIFKQERVGLHNRTFQMYKFRSMQVQPASTESRAWTTQNDPRVTGIGRFIRQTSIDELPQLINILKGDMSLVGPRPERPYFVEKFREEIPRYMIKHQVRPGMTGWAQINGYRGNTSIKRRIDYDLYYIENWTLGFDLKILFLTIFKGFINKNAY